MMSTMRGTTHVHENPACVRIRDCRAGTSVHRTCRHGECSNSDDQDRCQHECRSDRVSGSDRSRFWRQWWRYNLRYGGNVGQVLHQHLPGDQPSRVGLQPDQPVLDQPYGQQRLHEAADVPNRQLQPEHLLPGSELHEHAGHQQATALCRHSRWRDNVTAVSCWRGQLPAHSGLPLPANSDADGHVQRLDKELDRHRSGSDRWSLTNGLTSTGSRVRFAPGTQSQPSHRVIFMPIFWYTNL